MQLGILRINGTFSLLFLDYDSVMREVAERQNHIIANSLNMTRTPTYT